MNRRKAIIALSFGERTRDRKKRPFCFVSGAMSSINHKGVITGYAPVGFPIEFGFPIGRQIGNYPRNSN